jgi:hypothetical protein
MAWEIEYTNAFNQWWDTLTEREQDVLRGKINRLAFYGRGLSGPHSKPLKGLRHPLHELRGQNSGRPLRVFYAFDPRETAIVLIGGDKTGDMDFYKSYGPIALDLYDAHIARLEREGLI